MIWIIGGTSEARIIGDKINDLTNYVISIATPSGQDFFDAENLYIGRMSYEEMIVFARERKVTLIVDLTHPYARIVTENGVKVAEELNIEYIRYVRKKTEINSKLIYLSSYEEAYEYLTTIKGTVFFTTGSKNISEFEKIKSDNRFIYRILPALESLEICRKYNIHMRDIIAILGPFSKEYNKIMLKEYNSDYCIMKDSGMQGGTIEKLQACEELGIIPIIIGREIEEGIYNLDIIEEKIRKEHKRLYK